MLKNNAIKRIITSSTALFIMLIFCLFPKNEKYDIPSEVNYIEKETIPVYVMDKNNYVSRTDIIKKDIDIIPYIIDLLTIDSSNSYFLPTGFFPIIPKNTKLLSYNLENKLLKLNFSKELLNIDIKNEEKMIEAIIYSLCELENVDKIMIFVDNDSLLNLPNSKKKLPTILDKSYGINKIYDIDDIKKTSKTTIYYIGKNSNNLYYIPITKVTNSDIVPVEVIVKELKKSSILDTNLISYLNASFELKDYEILENSIKLSFNNNLIGNLNDNNITEEVKYMVALSLRDTYNINDIIININ